MKFNNHRVIENSHIFDLVQKHELYYDRRLDRQIVAPGPLYGYIKGVHNLYLKQIPSCLTLRKAGSRLSKEVRPYLVENGFFNFRGEAEEDPTPLLCAMSQEGLDSVSEMDTSDDIPYAEAPPSGIHYEDPWKVLAGWAFASQYREERPVINVWAQGCHRLQGKIRPDLYNSEGKNGTWFTQMSSHEGKMFLLLNHTHWGHLLQRVTKGLQDEPCKNFYKTLKRRISSFLLGKPDPAWTPAERKLFIEGGKRHTTYRAQRFLEVLKTVDGVFLQRYLSFPEEVWDWEKYDKFVLQLISILITDEFFDGTLTAHSVDEQRTHYEELKACRKRFKLVIHQDDPKPAFEREVFESRWIRSYLWETWRLAVRTSGHQRVYLAGTLSQTRGSGTPPPLVVIRSKRKFLRSIQEAPPDLTRTQSALIAAALDEVIGSIPDHVFTGLGTKARVTVTGSACWENTRAEGGTAQAILDIMTKYSDDRLVPVRDLDSGKVLEWIHKDQFESVGTAVFWACLEEVLRTPPEELRKVSLTIVKEPSKARVVTKGCAALKIVLDTISKICSYPLKKGIRTSESGMGKSHHGWNLFRDFFSEEMYDLLFTEDRKLREDDPYVDHISRIQTWEDVFFSSTDYQEATDRMIHSFSRIVGSRWMRKCGIPPILRGIVMAVCFQPRQVYFSATGPLSNIGLPVEGDTRVVTLYRGVLMGDPLTKVILHFSNVIARRLGQQLADASIFRHFTNGYEAAAIFHKAIWS
jgi:hypothetical protein